MVCNWKPNWKETREHLLGWWERQELVITIAGAPAASPPHEAAEDPGPPPSPEQAFTDPVWRARRNHYDLAHQTFPSDNLPMAATNMGPEALALLLGCEPHFTAETAWLDPPFKDVEHPESIPPFHFDPANKWWRIIEATLNECAALADGKYLVGCPGLVENVDILSALRDPQRLLIDMVEHPQWVTEKVMEINRVFFDTYQRCYDIIKLEDNSSAYCPFELWGPGKVIKIQCDAAAMFSPEMFRKFVIPGLTEQCERLDHTMYHLDGVQSIVHLESLLDIEELDAIEWTPQAGIEGGGNPRWYDMYRRILKAGKSVQAINVLPEEVKPLIKATGAEGMNIQVVSADEKQREGLLQLAQQHR